MPVPLTESRFIGLIDQHEQITFTNSNRFDTAGSLTANEVFAITNDSGDIVPMVARGTTAAGSTGEACIKGEFNVAKNSTSVFSTGDDVYWHASANQAVERSEAKTGDFYLGMCTLAAASGDDWVNVRIGKSMPAPAVPSVSSSVSTSSSSESSQSTSISSSSNSSSSSSAETKSVSSNSDTSSESTSSNSTSVSSESTSISSNSDTQ